MPVINTDVSFSFLYFGDKPRNALEILSKGFGLTWGPVRGSGLWSVGEEREKMRYNVPRAYILEAGGGVAFLTLWSLSNHLLFAAPTPRPFALLRISYLWGQYLYSLPCYMYSWCTFLPLALSLQKNCPFKTINHWEVDLIRLLLLIGHH